MKMDSLDPLNAEDEAALDAAIEAEVEKLTDPDAKAAARKLVNDSIAGAKAAQEEATTRRARQIHRQGSEFDAKDVTRVVVKIRGKVEYDGPFDKGGQMRVADLGKEHGRKLIVKAFINDGRTFRYRGNGARLTT